VHHPSASPTPRAPRGLGQLGVDALEHVVERRGVDQLQQGHLSSMANVGRNQPCPCGSGKKYKQCCLATDEAAAAAAREQQQRAAPPPPVRAPRFGRWPVVDDTSARIDQLSNTTIDLIHAGQFDEAERICQRLLDEYPEVLDGHMRLGQLFRARGEPKKAAEHLRLAAAIAFADDDASELGLSLAAEADSIDLTTP
jgi:tetratricopeptide (TPR) repeat protein